MSQMEVIEGTIEAVNERGVRLAGNWYNRSKYHVVDLPSVGAWVQLGVDPKGFIVEVTSLDSTNNKTAPQPERDTRLAVLAVAAGFGASRPDLKSADVLKIAELWFAWVNQ